MALVAKRHSYVNEKKQCFGDKEMVKGKKRRLSICLYFT